MFFDGHSDIWSDVTTKILEGEYNVLKKHHLQRLRKGEIEGAIFVAWIEPPYTDNPSKRLMEIYSSVEKEMETCNEVSIVKNYSEIEKAKRENKFYIIYGMEGMSGLNGSIDSIDEAIEKGVRHMSLTWNEENQFATGVLGNPDRGLTVLGREAVKKIMDKNIILDTSHLNDKSFWDIVALTDGPIVASHSNARSLCNSKRNLSDDQLKAIRGLNGLVGMNSFNMFVSEDVEKQNIDAFLKHMVYVSDLIGVEHVGFGFDFFEFLPEDSTKSYSLQETSITEGLEDCSKVPNLVKKMKEVGFSDKEIEKIARDNWLRIIKQRLG